jgi:protocatechuate 3,4-dioxygenase beta subunit
VLEVGVSEIVDPNGEASSDAAASTQSEISAEIASLASAYRAAVTGRPRETQPRLDYRPYRSSILRHPTKDLQRVDPDVIELAAPVFGAQDVSDVDADLTVQHDGEPIGERLVVTGRVVDGDGRPVRGQLVEIWQANAAGRYAHRVDDHDAPLDPNFDGAGRCLTDSQGRYRFVTIKPGAYPWRNHLNAWRPAHIHFSVFGRAFTQRLVTQMYFPGDPLFAQDPIFNSVPDRRAREAMICRFDLSVTEPDWALGYQWDIVLRGRGATVFEHPEDHR